MFVIINLSEPLDSDGFGNQSHIPAQRRPSFVHGTRDQAEQECLRLAQKYGGRFVIFEAVSVAEERTALVPTKVWKLDVAEERTALVPTKVWKLEPLCTLP